MRLRLLAVVAALMLPSLAAHADTLQTFEISIAFEHGVGFGGQVVLDTTTNLFTSLGGAAGGLPTGNGGFFSASQGVSNGDYFLDSATTGPYTLSIILPVTPLVGYNGSAVCTESLGSGCFASSYLDVPAISGSLTPIASTTVTPEPSSIALLGCRMNDRHSPMGVYTAAACEGLSGLLAFPPLRPTNLLYAVLGGSDHCVFVAGGYWLIRPLLPNRALTNAEVEVIRKSAPGQLPLSPDYLGPGFASKVKQPNTYAFVSQLEFATDVIVATAQAVCPIGHSSSFLLRTTRKHFFAADAVLL